MAFSFSRLIISNSNSTACKDAFRLAQEKYPKIERRGTASCVGEIDGYKIWLGFRRGVPDWECSCNTNTHIKIQEPCSHAIALSLIWDRSRSVPDPSQEDIEYLTKKN
jgi:hypothetical protein